MPETKERPILFSGPMVRAILEGRKTVTRRVLKRQPEPGDENKAFREAVPPSEAGNWSNRETWDGVPQQWVEGDTEYDWWKCPYGKSTDRLWVRETFNCDDYRYPADAPIEELTESLIFRADHDDHCRCFEEGVTWRPSIFMPRWASRITLEMASVRVERLLEITEQDAKAEGVEIRDILYPDEPQSAYSYVEQFKLLWDSINAKRGYSWDSNPWVWRIEFQRAEEVKQ